MSELEDRMREIAGRRYHHRHPFNERMHAGELKREEIQRWVLNRFHYQRHIPVKDALILAKLETPELRRMWIRRIHDHDDPGGGIERWLRLGEAVGVERERLVSGDEVLPGVRFAVEGYVNFCRLRSPLEAVASSLTEMFAPGLMRTRIEAFEKYYPWIDLAGLEYFRTRVSQGDRDSEEARGLVRQWTRTGDEQEKVLAALNFKCDVLWSLLDAVDRGE